jgi:hypothetical protein
MSDEARDQVAAVKSLAMAWRTAADHGLVEEPNDPDTLRRAADAIDEVLTQEFREKLKGANNRNR